MEKVGRYEQTTAWSNIDAGSCRWCFAVRGGREYFIKEYLDPKHPVNDTTSSEEKRARKLQKCYAFEQEKRRLFQAINTASDGNVVRVEDFFRIGGKYYMAMPKIYAEKLAEHEVAAKHFREKVRLCMVIAHALSCVHETGFIHFDVKHANIIFTRSPRGRLMAKLIDFDAGYFEDALPEDPEMLSGDPLYYAPEMFAAVMDGCIRVTCKADIYSLGILFHQSFVGFLPGIDWAQFGYTGEAAYYGEVPVVSEEMPERLRKLVERMLAFEAEDRPSAKEVYAYLRRIYDGDPEEAPASAVDFEVKIEPDVETEFETELESEMELVHEEESGSVFRGDQPGKHIWGSLGDL